jgi:hypothetical protein
MILAVARAPPVHIDTSVVKPPLDREDVRVEGGGALLRR